MKKSKKKKRRLPSQRRSESLEAYWQRILTQQGLGMARLKNMPGQKDG